MLERHVVDVGAGPFYAEEGNGLHGSKLYDLRLELRQLLARGVREAGAHQGIIRFPRLQLCNVATDGSFASWRWLLIFEALGGKRSGIGYSLDLGVVETLHRMVGS